jgi:polar amino acid transport system substrate-binding protein
MRRRLLLFSSSLPLLARARPTVVHVCGNVSLGKPEDGASPHRLLQAAFAQLPQLELAYTALPWQRCLSEAAANQYDAVLAASHTDERALHLRYPLDAQGRPDTRLRMFELGYALLKRKGTALRWDGTRISGSSARVGEAVGAERGHSIVQFARARGGVVEDRYPGFESLLASLKLGRIAGILLPQESAAQLLSDPEWMQRLELSGPSLQTKAYYLPVSSQFAAREPALVQQLWTQLAKQRQVPAFKQQFSLALSAGRRRDIQP